MFSCKTFTWRKPSTGTGRGVKNKIKLASYRPIICIIHNHKLVTLFDVTTEVESNIYQLNTLYRSVALTKIQRECVHSLTISLYAIAAHLRRNGVHFSQTSIIIIYTLYNYISCILNIQFSDTFRKTLGSSLHVLSA